MDLFPFREQVVRERFGYSLERIESFRKLVQPGRMEPLEGSRDRRKSERFNNEIARVLRGE